MAESLATKDGAGMVASQVGRGAAEGVLAVVDVFFEWILPIIAIVVGLYLASSIGLSGLIATLASEVAPAQWDKYTAIIAGLFAVAIWGAIAAALWSLSKRFDGHYARWVLKPIAGLFIGFAIGEAGALVMGKAPLNGQLGIMAQVGGTQVGALGGR